MRTIALSHTGRVSSEAKISERYSQSGQPRKFDTRDVPRVNLPAGFRRVGNQVEIRIEFSTCGIQGPSLVEVPAYLRTRTSADLRDLAPWPRTRLRDG